MKCDQNRRAQQGKNARFHRKVLFVFSGISVGIFYLRILVASMCFLLRSVLLTSKNKYVPN